MKIIVASEELPMCVLRGDVGDAIREHVSRPLKAVSQPHKASKIQIEFAEETDAALQVLPRPHFMGVNMLDDENMCFVGIPALYSSRHDADQKQIEDEMNRHRCHPVFAEKTVYADVVEEILRRNTYESVQRNLEHGRLFEEYTEFNQRYLGKIMEIYCEGDVVWIMDHSLLLLPQMLGNIPSGISFDVSFSTLFKCIPFWSRLLQSILHSRYIEFLDPASKDSFNLLVAQKTQILVNNTPFQNLNPPATGASRRGIEKDPTLQISGQRSGEPTILVPFDSAPHLLGVEAYLSRYRRRATILLLTSQISNPERHAEVSRLREYLEINYNAQMRPFVPTSDAEFYAVLRSCSICHCPEAADTCAFLGIPVVETNPHDFMDVADEIEAKMDVAGISSDVPSKAEWKSHFLEGLNAHAPSRRVEAKTEIDVDDREDRSVAEIVAEFRKNTTRTLVLDYDGTLTDIVAHPSMAAPTEDIRKLLVDLNGACRLVISTGRGMADADAFFPGEIEVFAEHGACHRVGGEWTEQPVFALRDLAWRIADFFRQRTPGAELESKKTGFTFHFRNVSPLIAAKQARALFEILRRLCGDRVKEGSCIIEVRSSAKSVAMQSVDGGFVLCAGDDVADEEMLAVCPGYTLRIGSADAETCARYIVRDPRSLRMLLGRLLE